VNVAGKPRSLVCHPSGLFLVRGLRSERQGGHVPGRRARRLALRADGRRTSRHVAGVDRDRPEGPLPPSRPTATPLGMGDISHCQDQRHDRQPPS
jgi:hypothetical protein